MTRDHEPKKKLPYRRPRLHAVDLVAEEVLGIGCKDATGLASGQPCVALNCAAIGS